jgi:hypothetical protein
VKTKLPANGQEYSSVEQVPAGVRQLHVGIMATVDANRNGIADLPDSSRQTVGQVSSSSVTIGTARPDPTRAWLFLAAVVMALWLLASFELGR